ncbi:MAG: efflux RND transporter periplasmic adaptor subunit, partial [Candidatus Hydrogenedentota bacterium]
MRDLLVFMTVFAVTATLACSDNVRSEADNSMEAKEVPVTVSRAAVRTVTMEMSTTGDVRAFAEVSVISEVAGTIESLPVERGEKVDAGGVIAVVEHAEASASVRQAEAALQAARAQVLQANATLKNLDVECERIRELFDAGTASKQVVDDISTRRDVAVAAKELALAQVAQAEAAVEQAGVFLENHFIHAPIGGVITERYVDRGDKNSPSEPIVSIAQVDPVKVIGDFPERDLPLLRVGQSAYLEVDAYPGKSFP